MGAKDFGILLGFLVALGIVLTLTISIPRPATTGTPYAQFQAQRAQWEERRPITYSVSIQRLCFCRIWSVRVAISEADVEQIRHELEPSDPSQFADRRYYPRNIDDVFRIIDAAYAARAYLIELSFDETYGFPVRAFIDTDRDTVDDEQTFTLSGFEPSHVG